MTHDDDRSAKSPFFWLASVVCFLVQFFRCRKIGSRNWRSAKLNGDTRRAVRLFLCRGSGTSIFRAVVFSHTSSFQQDNGSPGGAAFGLAGIH